MRKVQNLEATKTRQLLALARDQGVLRARDLEVHGIPRSCLQAPCQRGELVRAGRGLYIPADVDFTEHHTLVEAASRVSGGVICLLTALRFHALTTVNPTEVWMALRRGRRQPRVDHPPLHIVWFSGAAFSEGVEEHRIEGTMVRVSCAAKTVVDCFKYRHKIGLDVALEALRECRRGRAVSLDDLWHFARICRMTQVMRPYLEALT